MPKANMKAVIIAQHMWMCLKLNVVGIHFEMVEIGLHVATEIHLRIK